MRTAGTPIALAAAAFAAIPLLGVSHVPLPTQAAPSAQATQSKETSPGKSHVEIPDTKGETCLICHEGLDKAQVVHAPVAAGECTTCHEFAGSGDTTTVKLAGGATADASGVLCRACHDDVGKAAGGPGGHSPAASDECGTCHRPHGSDYRSLLASQEAELCTTCHDDVAEQLKLPNVHKPAAATCGLCHDPHGSANPAKTRETVNTLCLACHLLSTGTAKEGSKEGTQGPTLFGREVARPLAPLLSPETRVVLDPSRRRGHPVLGHPVSGPKNPLDETQPFTCGSCHGPHGTEGQWLTRFQGDDQSQFCVECHK